MTEPGQPAGRLGRAVERFNRRALHLTRPGPHWLLASVRIALLARVAGILVSLTVLIGEHLLGYDAPADRGSLGNEPLLLLFVLAVVFAPLLETLQIVLVHVATRRWLGLSGLVAASTVLAYFLHSPSSGIQATAAFMFLVMSYQYVSFRDEVGTGRAYWGVAITHAVLNGMMILVVSAIGYLESKPDEMRVIPSPSLASDLTATGP